MSLRILLDHSIPLRSGYTFRTLAILCEQLLQSIKDLLARRERWPALRQAGRRFVEEERHWTASIGNYRNAHTRLLHS